MSQRVLITGGASGFGKAMATRYVSDGARVLIADVNTEAGEAAARELGATFRKLDITDDAAWEEAREWCEQEWDGLDVLVNNAGVASSGRFEKMSLDDWRWVMDINLMGAVRGCHTFVPGFKAQGSGTIINVASMAAIVQLPAMSSYNVSKAALLALSQTLRHELAPYGITTTVVCPGFVKTNLPQNSRSVDPAAAEVMTKFMETSKVTPEDVAEQTITAAANGEYLVLTHEDGREFHRMQRRSPRKADEARSAFWGRLRSTIEGEA